MFLQLQDSQDSQLRSNSSFTSASNISPSLFGRFSRCSNSSLERLLIASPPSPWVCGVKGWVRSYIRFSLTLGCYQSITTTTLCDGVAWRRCVNSASIRRPHSLFHFPFQMFSGASDKMSSTQIFTFLKKRWQPNRTAEPEVQAVPPLRHPPSGRKSLLLPLLPPSPGEPSCLLPDGSICPRISGFIRF